MKYKGMTEGDKSSTEKLCKSRDLHFEGKIKVCKLNVESEKVDKQNCKQDKHGQKDNENITAFWGIHYFQLWDIKKVRVRKKR